MTSDHGVNSMRKTENSTPYRICSRTVMDTEGTDILFDTDGICLNAHNFLRDRSRLPKEDERQKYLDEIIQRIKAAGKGNQYDCIVGVSGGVDSTYVAYLAKKFGLRPLAVHVDNGWNSELAVNNIENAVKKLDIDLHTHVIDWSSFKDLQVAFLKASVSDAEIPSDHANRAVLMKIGVQEKIKYCLTGRNLSTEGILGNNWTYGNLDWKYIKNVHKLYGSQKLSNYPHVSLTKILFSLMFSRITDVSILNFVPYVKKDVLEVLKNELDYREYPAKHYESIYTRFFQSYILPEKFNIDKRKAHYSVLILTGQMTRDEALKKLEAPPYDKSSIEADKSFVIKKLGLDLEEFEKIMSLPVKRYTDYPNNSKYIVFSKNKYLLFVVKLLKKINILPKEFAARMIDSKVTA